MKTVSLFVPLWLVLAGCQGPAPELAPSSDEPVSILVSVGGVT